MVDPVASWASGAGGGGGGGGRKGELLGQPRMDLADRVLPSSGGGSDAGAAFGAAACGDLDLLRRVLSQAGPTSLRDSHRRTPAHVAAMMGQAAALQVVIEVCGVQCLDAVDAQGLTPVLYAHANGFNDMIRNIVRLATSGLV